MFEKAAAGATINLLKALHLSTKFVQYEGEPPRDWAIRIVKLANQYYPEKMWEDFTLREEDIAKRKELSLGIWFVLWQIAEQTGDNAEYYRAAHQSMQKATKDMDYGSTLNFAAWCMDMGVPLYRQFFEATREGIRVLDIYVKTGKLVTYQDKLLQFPTKKERFFK